MAQYPLRARTLRQLYGARLPIWLSRMSAHAASRTTIRGGVSVPLETDAKMAEPCPQPSPPKDKDEYTDTVLDRCIKICTITWCGVDVAEKILGLVGRVVR